jgi:hypothetical protein
MAFKLSEQLAQQAVIATLKSFMRTGTLRSVCSTFCAFQ